MSEVVDRFLRYVAIDTQSQDDAPCFPSTEKQKDLAALLVRELKEIGAADPRMDDYGYVYASIPSNIEGKAPVLAFIAHMDTSPAVSGKDVKARIEKFNGESMTLSEGNVLSVSDYPEIAKYKGMDLIVSDGTTVLGADNKAAVAFYRANEFEELSRVPGAHAELLLMEKKLIQ